MSDALGLSIGTTNLVAVRDGRPPVSRRSVLTLFRDRAPEVGAPGQYPPPDQPGLVLASFVERAGDPVPIVASDGSSHRAEYVLVEALDAVARTVGGGAPITIAVPAHWNPAMLGALRAAVATKATLNPNGVAPSFIPDAGAALSGLRVSPGLPPNGVVVLCDLGGTGTSITLADASAGLAIIGDTVRYPDFSGDLIDQALLNHVVAGIAQSGAGDPNSTAAVGSLVRLRDECRQAKERLSAETATAVPAQLPGHAADFRVTRDDLERLIDRPLTGLLDAVQDTLNRYRIPPSAVSAVATIGGGAAIPIVTQRLSQQLRAPVVTTPTPLLSTAVGALIVADRGLSPDTPTGMAPAAGATGLAPAAGATGMAPTTGWVPDGGATQMAPAEGAPTSSAEQLAWSQDEGAGGDPLPYGGDDYAATPGGATGARPAMVYAHDEEDDQPDEAPLAWYKRPPILFGAAAAALLLAAGGAAITLTSSSEPSTPVTATATSYTTDANGNTVPVLPPHSESQVVTITKSNGETSTSVAPPVTTTETTPSTTSSTTTTSTATTTTTSTTTTTTTQPPTTTTTQPPITTTSPPPSTTSARPPTEPPTSAKPATSAATATATAAPAARPEVTIPVLAPPAP